MPAAIDIWLGQCEDGFAIYAATKSEKSPNIDLVTRICLVGMHMHEPSMAAWWSARQTESLKLATWELFDKAIHSCFMPKGYKLLALHMFFCCSQGSLPFLDYAATLANARNAIGSTVITAFVYKYQLLFCAHHMLILRIMAIADFDINSISFDNLVVLMAMQWDSLVAEGLAQPATGARFAPAPPIVPSTSGSYAPCLLPLTDAEKERLQTVGGCWRCRKAPKDTSWVPHVGRMCPGDSALGISPGHDYVPPVVVKKEFVGAVTLLLAFDDDGEDQPDIYADDNDDKFYQDNDTD